MPLQDEVASLKREIESMRAHMDASTRKWQDRAAEWDEEEKSLAKQLEDAVYDVNREREKVASYREEIQSLRVQLEAYKSNGSAALPAKGPERVAATAAAAVAADGRDPFEAEWKPFHTEAASNEHRGRYADAEQLYRQVLAIRSDRSGASSVAAAAASRDVGRILALQKKYGSPPI